MTRTDRPTPPPELDDDLRAFLEALGEADLETLRTVATYVDELVAWTDAERNAESGSSTGSDEATAGHRDRSADEEASGSEDPPDDPPFPDDVPDGASVSVDEIAGTTYYYFQWREGDEIRSKTVARDE
ncbi:hypothetical protein [Halosolutus gelatinilyticus]|uniref:hypothetical protein n=1 Tax=Halosolutus gelatinilyticus TaxID=2931975 RepID=UPI001FF52827|nr:hypothetical protein [Halosolutus gelatinilyticus]